MTFKGSGIVWNPKKDKQLVDFNVDKEYETHDEYEINTLIDTPNVQCIESGDVIAEVQPEEIEIEIEEQESDNIEVVADIPLTNQQMKEILDDAGIEYRKKATKADLEKLLEGVDNE